VSVDLTDLAIKIMGDPDLMDGELVLDPDDDDPRDQFEALVCTAHLALECEARPTLANLMDPIHRAAWAEASRRRRVLYIADLARSIREGPEGLLAELDDGDALAAKSAAEGARLILGVT